MLGRLAFGPVRAAARSSRGLLEDEVNRAIQAAFAGPLPEVVGRALVEHRVVERVVAEMLETSAAQGRDTDRALEAAADSVVRSAAFKRALKEILSSPEVRRALSQQTVGFGSELAGAARSRARRFDDAAEARVHRWIRRPLRPLSRQFSGVGSRGVALVIDAALAQLAFLVVAASVALVVGLVGELRPGWFAGSAAAIGWLLVAGAYFVGFWHTAGETLGLRLMRSRVVTSSGAPPSVPRAFVRFVGLILAIIPLGAGFLPALVDGRRRALPDFLAGTEVVYDLEPVEAGTEADAASTGHDENMNAVTGRGILGSG